MRRVKRWMALAAALLLFSFCACGRQSVQSAAGDAAAAPAAGQAAMRAAGLRAAVVLDGPANGRAWNADCCAGLLQARDILGYEIDIAENVAPADFEQAFRAYAEAGYDLIIAPGLQYLPAVEALYADYPGTHFAGFNFPFTAGNVTSLNFNHLQAGFLAGALAGLCTKTGSVGFIGGDEVSSTMNVMRGAGQGIRHVRGDVQFTVSTVGAWNDPAKAKGLAQTQIGSQGVDVILAYGDGGNRGVVEAAEGKAACIVVDAIDARVTAPDTVCGGVLLSNSAMVLFAADIVAAGQSGRAVVGDVANGVVRLGSFGTAVDGATAETLGGIYDDIASGNITIT